MARYFPLLNHSVKTSKLTKNRMEWRNEWRSNLYEKQKVSRRFYTPVYRVIERERESHIWYMHISCSDRDH